jgi:hypothetical protein
MPSLVLICLPDDHTAEPELAGRHPELQWLIMIGFRQIVEALSHSGFWKEMVIMAIEDDPQMALNHISGYRTTAYLAGPYVKEAKSFRPITHTSILRTIEQILGLPPMNQFDASASPMFDCFTSQADFRPFMAAANRIPLMSSIPGQKTSRINCLKRMPWFLPA